MNDLFNSFECSGSNLHIFDEPSTSTKPRQIFSKEVQLLNNLIEQASTAYSNGELTKALEFYDQAVMIDPANNVLYANRSAIYLKLGEIQKAIEEASHSIQLDPEWSKVILLFFKFQVRFTKTGLLP